MAPEIKRILIGVFFGGICGAGISLIIARFSVCVCPLACNTLLMTFVGVLCGAVLSQGRH